MGGFVGTAEGTTKYVEELVNDWIEQLKQLAAIAKTEPQAAYSAFTAGYKHKMTYYIRTISNLSTILEPLDETVTKEFIPAITDGHHCSEDERRLLSLPVRLGGLGLPIFSELCDREYENSLKATKQLAVRIQAQNSAYEIDVDRQKEIESQIKRDRREYEEKTIEELKKKMSKESLRANELAQMKGASAWLNAIPLEAEGYVLNKRKFYDAVSLRYRWPLSRLPSKCNGCGKDFDVDHAMNCATGGFIHRRHDGIRDICAKILDDVAYDVRTEPPLQPLTGEVLPPSANSEAEARLDISARGFWQRGGLAFFDVRVFNPYAKSHLPVKLETVFRQQENTKKREYNERVIRIEHGSSTPIVTNAYGGYRRETSRFISLLIEKVAEKRDMHTSLDAN